MLEPLFNKVTDIQSCIIIKERLQRRSFPVNFAKFLKIPLLQNTSGGSGIRQK